jgi:hypothetical protein
MRIEINTDTQTWSYVKSALRSAGLRYLLQEQLFSPNKELFVEPRAEEPEGGKLTHGMIVYPGGCLVGSEIQEVYDQEIGKS